MYCRLIITICILKIGITPILGQNHLPPIGLNRINVEQDPLRRYIVHPQRIIWQSSDSLVLNPEALLQPGTGQAYFGSQPLCRIINKDGLVSGFILDFGVQLHGGIQITTSQSNNVTRKIRIRFGESVSEVMASVRGSGYPHEGRNATNHHAMRDFDLTLPGYGTIEIGNTGFRFIRIDLAEPSSSLTLKEVRAVALLRDLPYLGSFRSNDEQLNRIWETGAYTVHLNMLNYLVDGVKRDRMVWAGDMHPEMMAIAAVFGNQNIVPKTLDFLKETTPLPEFMNGIPSYSMWWVIMQHDWYLYQGSLDYLKEQQDYLIELLRIFEDYVNDSGKEILHDKGMRFIDWPTYKDTIAVHAGLQAMMVMTFNLGANLCDYLKLPLKADHYKTLADKMKKHVPDTNKRNQVAALYALSGMADAKRMNAEIIRKNGVNSYSAFFGYYMLMAQAKAGDFGNALDNIRQFWGGMLDLGATTFWEEFNLSEAYNAARIDEIVPSGKFDYHSNTGIECYIGLRRSLCHGWAAGPTPWLSQYVLGITPLEPGFKKVRITPNLGDLKWAEGTFPTPKGIIEVSHVKLKNGKIKSTIKVPKGIMVVK